MVQLLPAFLAVEPEEADGLYASCVPITGVGTVLSNSASPDHRWSSSFRVSSFRFFLAAQEEQRRGSMLVFQGS
jgi:hypothetical protein